jgi:hypothetical protein
MTRVHWTPVPLKRLRGSVWETCLHANTGGGNGGDTADGDEAKTAPRDSDGFLVEQWSFDAAMVESTFQAKQTKKKGAAGDDDDADVAAAVTTAKAAVHVDLGLVDAKRAYTVAISLARFKSDAKTKADAAALVADIMRMDDLFTLEQLIILQKLLPTADEAEAIAEYRKCGGDVALFGDVETWFAQCGRQPQLRARLRIAIFAQEFPSTVRSLEQGLEAVEDAYTEVRSSAPLKVLLKAVLDLGNYLNGGTRTGQAYGFSLDGLTKLRGVKSVDNATTLLHFLARLVADTDAAADADLLPSLAHVAVGARVEQAFLTAEVKQIRQNLEFLRRFLETSPPPRPRTPGTSPAPTSDRKSTGGGGGDGDGAVVVAAADTASATTPPTPEAIQQFYDYAAARHRVVDARLTALTRQLGVTITDYFAEAAQPWESFFDSLNRFLTAYARARADLELEALKKSMEESGQRTAAMLQEKQEARVAARARMRADAAVKAATQARHVASYDTGAATAAAAAATSGGVGSALNDSSDADYERAKAKKARRKAARRAAALSDIAALSIDLPDSSSSSSLSSSSSSSSKATNDLAIDDLNGLAIDEVDAAHRAHMESLAN